MKERLTTDNPTTNTKNMLNLAYAKDGYVYLRYGVNDVNLCDYVSEFATKQGCNYTANEILEGACLECDCEVNLLYCLAVQAAELRERLKYYEDLDEQGQLIRPPCKVGDIVYWQTPYGIEELTVDLIKIIGNQEIRIRARRFVKEIVYFSLEHFGKTVFLTREEAQAKLKEGVQR